MTTTVSNSKTQPAVTLDKLHIDSFTFQQERAKTPKRVVGLSGVLYGFDGNGDPVYDKETFTTSDKDLDSTVIGNWIAGGGTLESFMAAYAAAKITVNDAIVAGTLTDAMLMAYFEAALGRIFELHGKINVSGVA